MQRNFYFILLCILLFPVGSELLFGLRWLDIFLAFSLLFVFLYRAAIRSKVITIGSFFLIITTLNAMGSLLIGKEPNLSGYFVFAKISLHMFSLLMLESAFRSLSNLHLKKVNNFFLLIMSILSVWCIYSFSLEPLKRVGFPFSNSLAVDSHVLGSVLAFFTAFLAINIRFDTSRFKANTLGCILLSFTAALTTGSRSIFLMFIIAAILFLSRRMLALDTKRLNVAAVFFIIISPLVVLQYIDTTELRSLQFSMQNASEAKRVANLFKVFFELEESYYVFGRGFFTADTMYFDGTLTFMLYNLGLVGALVFFTITIVSMLRYLRFGSPDSLFFTLALSLLFVSEFFLLSRWFIPCVIAYLCISEKCRRELKRPINS